MSDSLCVALITDVFHGPDGSERLVERLREARGLDAELAILPELPLDPWIAVGRQASPRDAEPPGGPRCRTMQDASREAGIAVLGGAILEVDGVRHNTALLFGPDGRLRKSYRKLHLPEEAGYWETSHYEPGDLPPEPFELGGFPLGLQICSDLNRPMGSQLLAAAGAEAVLAPRATPGATYPRWRLVMRSVAAVGACYLLSANRPPEEGTLNSGPSIAVSPDGSVLEETDVPVVAVTLRRAVVAEARASYPGYLPFRPSVFGPAWTRLGDIS